MGPPSTSSVRTVAPGKLVLSGEYAVLLGAPALVAAVDRCATCSLELADTGNWSIRSQPAFWNSDLTLDEIETSETRDLVVQVLKCLGAQTDLPPHARLAVDTRPLFHFGKKMGLGSSAATLVSLYVALCTMHNVPHTLEGAIDLHSQINRSGSGLDVATSYQGGVIQFQDHGVKPAGIPEGLKFRIFYAGASTTTSDRVLSFKSWISSQPKNTRDRFFAASVGVVESTDKAGEFLDALRYFNEIQELIDIESGLGIWGPQHRAMRSLANRDAVLYKPSGAGGGDVGLAISTDEEVLNKLAADAERIGLMPIDASLGYQGVRVDTTF